MPDRTPYHPTRVGRLLWIVPLGYLYLFSSPALVVSKGQQTSTTHFRGPVILRDTHFCGPRKGQMRSIIRDIDLVFAPRRREVSPDLLDQEGQTDSFPSFEVAAKCPLPE